MKRFLLYIAVLICCFASAAYADPNEPNSSSDSNSLTDPNELIEPDLPDVIINAVPIRLQEPNELKNDPGDPNDPNNPPSKLVTAITPVEKKRPKSISFNISAATDLPEFKYRLLPLDMEKDEGDAAERYLKAIDTLPADFSNTAIKDLLDMPMDKFDANIAGSIIKASTKSLELIRQGSILRQCQCKWTKDKGDKDAFSLLEGLNSLTSLVALKTRLDTSLGQYDTAVESIRDGLAMSRHIANSDSIIQAVAGANTASIMLKGVEELVQSPNAPSLYRSLGDLPKPLVNLNMAVAAIAKAEAERISKESRESRHSRSGIYIPGRSKGKGYMLYNEIELEVEEAVDSPNSHEDMFLQMNELDRLVAALQCLEAVRYYATVNSGKLPQSLGDITDLSLPFDPVTQRPFRYILGEEKALLASPVTDKQADLQSTIYFEISINQ